MKKYVDKKIVLLLLSFYIISCSSDDNQKSTNQDRGEIKFEYNNETLNFGERSFNGWILNDKNDTIGRSYTTRILYGQPWKDQQKFILNAYISNNQITEIQVEFLPLQSDKGGRVYQNESLDNPLKFKNTRFDGNWLNAEFEGKLLFNPYDQTDFVEIKNGKINIPLKGLNIPENY